SKSIRREVIFYGEDGRAKVSWADRSGTGLFTERIFTVKANLALKSGTKVIGMLLSSGATSEELWWTGAGCGFKSQTASGQRRIKTRIDCVAEMLNDFLF